MKSTVSLAAHKQTKPEDRRRLDYGLEGTPKTSSRLVGVGGGEESQGYLPGLVLYRQRLNLLEKRHTEEHIPSRWLLEFSEIFKNGHLGSV